jgi:hypothetical protein
MLPTMTPSAAGVQMARNGSTHRPVWLLCLIFTHELGLSSNPTPFFALVEGR